ncbi:hypothetical protein GRI89_13555 [Altererythrobacter salegens]|uniref:Tetratricopeptide repeat protein n=1 Tax=Croceibacterium salegens TaxID=1737568 RepID=A0A6I4T061_9SPHN|nr:hypothetical protein [Croceibacterium salegens]MXO60566.1 hypothetical protein [Croceibacterium salegens]
MAWVRNSIALLACLALAVVSALAAAAQVFEVHQPQRALAAGVSVGFARANAAGLLLSAGAVKDIARPIDASKVDSQTITALARASYTAEPLNVAAIRTLGLLAEAKGETGRSADLMRNAVKLTRRDLPTNVWLIRTDGANSDARGMLSAFDNALRTSQRARALLIPGLFQYLDRQDLVAPVLGMLRQNPNWETDFWSNAHTNPKAMHNVVSIRIARGQDGYHPPAGYDLRIMQQLVRTAQFEDAKRLSDYLDPGQDRTAIVRNPGFEQKPGMAPFAWDLQFAADLSARIERPQGLLAFTSYGGGAAQVARQLVALPAGPLVFSAKAGTAGASSDVRFRLVCAVSTAGPVIELGGIGAGPKLFQRPPGACTYYWLEIAMAASDRREVRDVAIDRISIVKDSAGSRR